jgi:lysophospholipase L1-like esterase
MRILFSGVTGGGCRSVVMILIMVLMIEFGITAWAEEKPGRGFPQGNTGKDPLIERLEGFAAKDKAAQPPKDAVEFTGSSMFEGWTEVAAQMAPAPAFNRAIGGSKTADILKYLDQIVIQYQPKVVVLYSGINDVSEGLTSDAATGNLQKIIEVINTKLPDTRIIYIAMLNAANRPESAGLISDANNRMKKYAGTNPRMIYLDVSPELVDDKGATRREFLNEEGSHYNASAYEAMAKVVKPAVQKAWSQK